MVLGPRGVRGFVNAAIMQYANEIFTLTSLKVGMARARHKRSSQLNQSDIPERS